MLITESLVVERNLLRAVRKQTEKGPSPRLRIFIWSTEMHSPHRTILSKITSFEARRTAPVTALAQAPQRCVALHIKKKKKKKERNCRGSWEIEFVFLAEDRM